ncbi:LytR/AlgR family response regulator transcription factor [Halanaerobaculum tunisiense]
MNNLRTIIVDDEFPARNELSFILAEIDDIKLIGEANNGLQALQLIKNKEPDLVFLDIQMPGKTGLEVAREVQNFAKIPKIIFLTAYSDYALEAFQVNAINYILKPYEKEQVYETIDRVRELYTGSNQQLKDKFEKLVDKLEQNQQGIDIDKLAVKTNRGRMKLIEYKQIILFYTKNKQVYAKTYEQEYEVDLNLSELEEKLSGANFLRIHRSYIVNLEQIKEVIPWFKGKYQVVMNDKANTQVPVSRTKVKKIQEIFDL